MLYTGTKRVRACLHGLLQRKYLVCYDSNRVSWWGERVDVDLIIVLREVGAKVSKPQPECGQPKKLRVDRLLVPIEI